MSAWRFAGVMICFCLGVSLGGTFGFLPDYSVPPDRWKTTCQLINESDVVIFAELTSPCDGKAGHKFEVLETIKGKVFAQSISANIDHQADAVTRHCFLEVGELYLVFLEERMENWQVAAGGCGVFHTDQKSKRLTGAAGSRVGIELHGSGINNSLQLVRGMVKTKCLPKRDLTTTAYMPSIRF